MNLVIAAKEAVRTAVIGSESVSVTKFKMTSNGIMLHLMLPPCFPRGMRRTNKLSNLLAVLIIASNRQESESLGKIY